MNTTKLLSSILALAVTAIFISFAPSIKTTSAWVNRDKVPAEPLKSVFIIAFTDNMEVRSNLENNLAAAAQKRGKPIKACTSSALWT